jgi:elongation factor 1 alpha-like protein
VFYHLQLPLILNHSLDQLEPPTRDLDGPLRLPLSNVFKTAGAGCGVAGRVSSGIIQVGERVRVLPGDETAVVKCKFF